MSFRATDRDELIQAAFWQRGLWVTDRFDLYTRATDRRVGRITEFWLSRSEWCSRVQFDVPQATAEARAGRMVKGDPLLARVDAPLPAGLACMLCEAPSEYWACAACDPDRAAPPALAVPDRPELPRELTGALALTPEHKPVSIVFTLKQARGALEARPATALPVLCVALDHKRTAWAETVADAENFYPEVKNGA